MITPFGVPFDTAVICGLVLVVVAIVLAGRRRRDRQGKRGRR